MSSINSGIDFIYGNQSSTEFGVSLASGFGSITRSSSSETRSIIRSKNISDRSYSFHGVKYDSPLSFDLIIYNTDGSFIDTYKERELKKWLMSDNEQWLQIDQDDHSDLFYFCIGVSAELLDVGTYSGGMKINFECNSNGAWSSIKPKTYTTVNGLLDFKINIDADYNNEIIKPSLIITSNSTGTITIKNNTRNESIIISNCIVGEQIVLDGDNGKISTTNGILLDKWNKKFLKLQDSINDITLTGNFSMKLSYRLPIRVGG